MPRQLIPLEISQQSTKQDRAANPKAARQGPASRATSTGSDGFRRKQQESLTPGVSDPDWQSKANCLGVDPDLFFPERGASTREAKAVCRGCVVREDCLEYALANGEKFGIWGGMSERERRRVRRSRQLAMRRPSGAA